METINKNKTLTEATEILNTNAVKFDWNITNVIDETKLSFSSQNQKKKYQRAINMACKKGTRRAFNSLFYVMHRNGCDNVKVELGAKEQAIQAKRKIWKKLQAESELALTAYKEEKGTFYKDR